jgi:poly(rC)-binding protein 2/3/4
MSKRRLSEGSVEGPEFKRVNNNVDGDTVTANAESEATEETSVSLRSIISTTIGDAIEANEKGILEPLKAMSDSFIIGEKIRGANERILTIKADSRSLAEILGRVAEFAAKTNWGRHFPGSDSTSTSTTSITGTGSKKGRTKGAAPVAAVNEEEEKRQETKPISIRLLVPEQLVISALKSPLDLPEKTQLKLIENSTKAKLELSRSQLPSSSERSLSVRGNSQEVKSAIESLADIYGKNQKTLAYFPLILYVPRVVTGLYGHPDTFQRQMLNSTLAALNPYLIPASDNAAAAGGSVVFSAAPTTDTSASTANVIPNATADDEISNTQGGMQQAQMQALSATPGQPLTQHIYIPNEMVGAIIGKGGTKINEIRQSSGSVIRVNEPSEVDQQAGSSGSKIVPGGLNSTERMITITGTPEQNQMALYLLYQRIESERHHHK